MNIAVLIGRLTKDPEVRQAQSGTTVGRFTLAVDKDTKQGGADFLPVITFGKTADLVAKYCAKGMLVGVIGSISTGSYEKDGRKVYTTDIIAQRVEFLSKSEPKPAAGNDDLPFGDEDLPF